MSIMSRQEYADSISQDPMNSKGQRSWRNTPNSAYNCGGFALSVYDWVTPYVLTENYPIDTEGLYTDEERECLMLALNDADWSEEDIENEILERDVQFLLEEYPFLEQVNLEDCTDDETIIAYRLFIIWDHDLKEVADTDFHFKIRYHGFWFEKMGSESITLCQLDADQPWIYEKSGATYTSQIAYFTTRRKCL